ncbi:MAG: DUF294 nucleotidyltransferase-like domain-containing protein [Limnohabitans sp.]|jgi:CBS domain-containing protein
MNPTLSPASTDTGLLNLQLSELLKKEPVTLPPQATVREVAQTMRTHGVSSVMLVEQEHLFGLITDRDLRNRVLADDLPLQTPAADVATLAPITLQKDQPAFSALLLMARHNIHHVPVMHGTRVAGMVTATDLTQQSSTSPVFLAGEIHQQNSLEGLVQASHRIRDLQMALSSAQTSAYNLGHVISTITDALTERLIHLAEAELGPPPVDYVWVAAGSQGRMEQTAKSDQDNCLILSDDYDEAAHGEYFRQFARRVCDGLASCGYVYCPGEMMAMTDRWRQPLRIWREYFQHWIKVPDGMSLMLTTVFFDIRAVHGNQSLLDQLRNEVLEQTRGNTLFLAHMVRNCIKMRPALGWFGQIKPITQGEHTGTIDLKHNGIVPIVDLARIYTLAGGLDPVNTHDRLMAAMHSQEVTPSAIKDLQEMLEFISNLRIRHQTRRMKTGKPADNYVRLLGLSNFEKRQLKDAFRLITSLQNALANRYRF